MDTELTREELFLRVWARPSQEVARELGISDVALGKRCKKLQVPKPPPGYWAQIRAGRRLKKPMLKAFSEQLAAQQKRRTARRNTQRGWLGLSPLQADIFHKAVFEASSAGIDLGELDITRSGARLLNSDLAVQLIMIIQHRYVGWLKERSPSGQVAHPAIRSVQALVAKLLPLAKAHTLVLEKAAERYDRGDRYPKVIIRLTYAFKQQVANLYRLVVDHQLSYVVWDLGPFEHAWIVQYHYHYEDYSKTHSQLCVSRDTLWVDCRVNHPGWDDGYQERIKTAEMSLNDIVPVDLAPKADVILPAVVDLPKLHLSKKRINAFVDAEHAYDILSSAVYQHDYPVPEEHLVLLEKLQFGCDASGPLTAARAACRKLEDDMERWELMMDSEREAICAEALGVALGDTILTQSQGKAVRLKIDHMSTHVTESNTLRFYIRGRRYRKDGILGKRDDSIFVSTGSGSEK